MGVDDVRAGALRGEHGQQAAMFGGSPSTGYAGELAAFLRPVFDESGLEAVWVDSSPSGGEAARRRLPQPTAGSVSGRP